MGPMPLGFSLCRGEGQRDREYRAVSDFGMAVDLALVALDDNLADRGEAESAAGLVGCRWCAIESLVHALAVCC